jgi:hypothetical protein
MNLEDLTFQNPNPPTPLQVLAGLLENAEYDPDKDLYTIRVSGTLYRHWTESQADTSNT